MMDNYSLADVAAATRGNNCNDGFCGGGNAWVLIILFAMIFGWGGFGFGGRGGPAGEPVTESALCNSMNFNNLENAVGRINDNQAAIARQTDNAICQIGYQNAQLSNQTQRDLCLGFAAINANMNAGFAQQAQCCCDTQRAIDGVNYNAAMNTAAINANTTAQTQKILDAICGNRMADMQNQINQLQLQAALCGIPRTTPYGYGIVPQFAHFPNNCGCNNI